MKKTLLKLMLIAGMAVALYGQVEPSPSNAACPSFCFHLTCGGAHAHCNSRGQCVCP